MRSPHRSEGAVDLSGGVGQLDGLGEGDVACVSLGLGKAGCGQVGGVEAGLEGNALTGGVALPSFQEIQAFKKDVSRNIHIQTTNSGPLLNTDFPCLPAYRYILQ